MLQSHGMHDPCAVPRSRDPCCTPRVLLQLLGDGDDLIGQCFIDADYLYSQPNHEIHEK